MKKIITVAAIAATLASCSKDNDSCTYTTSDGRYYGNEAPTAEQIKQWEQQCGCTITVTKECH